VTRRTFSSAFFRRSAGVSRSSHQNRLTSASNCVPSRYSPPRLRWCRETEAGAPSPFWRHTRRPASGDLPEGSSWWVTRRSPSGPTMRLLWGGLQEGRGAPTPTPPGELPSAVSVHTGQSGSDNSSHSRHTHSRPSASCALSAAGTIVTPQTGQIGASLSSATQRPRYRSVRPVEVAAS
jgi:hypothetical protein